MENAIESEYPEIRSAASRALHSGKILGFEIERPGIIKTLSDFLEKLINSSRLDKVLIKSGLVKKRKTKCPK
jgi:hypothetical protein